MTKKQRFLQENKGLFWDTKLTGLSDHAITEKVLNYGNIQNIKTWFDLIGVKKVKKIFFKQISKKRVNYRPETKNYFKLYFNKHV